MQLAEAANLLAGAHLNPSQPTTWADLGCGRGVFTYALARLLAPGSTIYAIDQSPQSLRPTGGNNVAIHFQQADFEADPLPLEALDGILMANALHYVADKPALLEKLQRVRTPTAPFLIVEYDTMQANPWVPYPIDEAHLRRLFIDSGYRRVEKMGERPSVYGAMMYVCCIRP